jgi:hypothetical protein
MTRIAAYLTRTYTRLRALRASLGSDRQPDLGEKVGYFCAALRINNGALHRCRTYSIVLPNMMSPISR